ncbi:hypothetical protein ACI3KX_20995 [Microbacterium sp. ZW CA_36]|uniref:hypothetical protein n=1 Tax=Microbacterium sp. ZW CA_36 TaxID=3378078 RepID=UPI0038549AC2
MSIRDRVARSEPFAPAADRFAVVALFRPAEDGASFSRSAWPAHVTLCSNRRAACVAVVRLTGDDATIVAAFALPDEGIGVNADIPGPAAPGVPRLARRDVGPAQPDVTPPNALGDA